MPTNLSNLQQTLDDDPTNVLESDVQPLDSDLTAVAALATTAFGRGFLALANAGAALTYLGAAAPVWGGVTGTLADQTDLQTALNAKQTLDSDLTAIAALTTTAYGRSFLPLADASAARTLIGAVIGTNVQAYDAFLTSIAALGTAADKLIYTTAVDTAAEASLTAAGRAILDDADNTAQRVTLGLVIGTDVLAPSGSGASLTALNASNLASGTVPTARLATGTADATTYHRGDGTWATISGAGLGDASTNTASSVDSEITLFSGTGGKTLKRATGTGVAHVTSGVLSASAVVLTSEVSGALPIANGGTATATPALVEGTNIDITGTWPNNTITNLMVAAPAFVTLTDGATVTITCDTAKVSQNSILTIGGNRTLAFSGLAAGMTGVLIVIQDGSGNRTLALPSATTDKVINGGGGVITLSTSAGAIDVLTWIAYTATSVAWTYGRNYT